MKITKEQIEEIKAGFKLGLKQKDLAERYGITQGRVSQLLKSLKPLNLKDKGLLATDTDSLPLRNAVPVFTDKQLSLEFTEGE